MRIKASHESRNLLMFSCCINRIDSFHQLLHFSNILINSLARLLLVVIEFLLSHYNSCIISKIIDEGLSKSDSRQCTILLSDCSMYWIGNYIGLSFLKPSESSVSKIGRCNG